MSSWRIWVLFSLLSVVFCGMLETCGKYGVRTHAHRHRVPCAAVRWLSGLPDIVHHCALSHYLWCRTVSTDTAMHSCEIWECSQIKGCLSPSHLELVIVLKEQQSNAELSSQRYKYVLVWKCWNRAGEIPALSTIIPWQQGFLITHCFYPQVSFIYRKLQL